MRPAGGLGNPEGSPGGPAAQHQVRGAVAPRGLELEYHLPRSVSLHPFVRERRAGDIAAHLFQPRSQVAQRGVIALSGPTL